MTCMHSSMLSQPLAVLQVATTLSTTFFEGWVALGVIFRLFTPAALLSAGGVALGEGAVNSDLAASRA